MPPSSIEPTLAGASSSAARDAAQDHQLGAEALGLAAGQPGQLGAADPVRETRRSSRSARCATPGRPARRARGRASTARRTRRRPRRRARRAGADDRQVVVRASRRSMLPPRLGQRLDRGGRAPVAVDHDRQRRRPVEPRSREQRARPPAMPASSQLVRLRDRVRKSRSRWCSGSRCSPTTVTVGRIGLNAAVHRLTLHDVSLAIDGRRRDAQGAARA